MGVMAVQAERNDDPRKLREILCKAAELASEHRLGSVVIGLAGREGDLLFPEVVNFVESALRVDDGIFRMTRERVVLHLADVDRARAAEIVERVLAEFRERFATSEEPAIRVRYFEVTPGDDVELTVKHVLPRLFAASS